MNNFFTVFVFSICATFAGTLSADFSGDFDVSNWSLITNGGNGFVDTSGAPASILLRGSNDGSSIPKNTDYQITILQDGEIGFSWNHTSIGEVLANDPFLYGVNGAFTIVSNTPSKTFGSGTLSGIQVLAGQTFTFRINSNNQNSASSVTISNFTFTPNDIPEPGTYAMLASSLAVCAWVSKKRKVTAS